MYKTRRETREYLASLSAEMASKELMENEIRLFVIPSYTALPYAKEVCHSDLLLGAQNMSWEECGALTGEISPLMLKEEGVDLVELGHSERRHVFGETNEQINSKVLCGLRNEFIVLLCVGEDAREKADGISDEILRIQLKLGLRGVKADQTSSIWIAYEPVWAIGESGIPASAEYANEKHKMIRETLCQMFSEELGTRIPILYGGSVNSDNASALISMPFVDGLFIGRSAWDAKCFSNLIDQVLIQFRQSKQGKL